MDCIRQRDVLMRCIRAFFYDRDFVEVETPIRINAPCMELHIDAEPSGSHYLRTSPELFHKRLLASGHKRIFEIGKCFRRDEKGDLHNPEYTMLEWYRTNADYMNMLEDTKQLIESIAGIDGSCLANPMNWQELSVSAAFLEFAGWNPIGNYDEARFDMDLVEKVEPAIKRLGGAVFLKDYPVEAAALSRKKPNRSNIAERWELYIDGVEIANAYSELTDAEEQRQRFEECAELRKAMNKPVYPIDEEFLASLPKMPPAGGVALGVDRLLMLFSGANSLDSILPFRQ